MTHLRTLTALVAGLALLTMGCSDDDTVATTTPGDPTTTASAAADGSTTGTATTSGMRQVTGEVFYRERIAMPEGATVTVRLVDVSLQDVGAELLDEQVITEPGNVPVAFTLEVDPALIDERNSYAVEAAINGPGGELLWINDTTMPVLTQGFPDEIEVLVVAAM